MTLPSRYHEEAEREVREANKPKLMAIAEHIRVAIEKTKIMEKVE